MEPTITPENTPFAEIPNRAETLKVLRMMGEFEPILQLSGDADGYGARWMLDGQEIHPSIAGYLIKAGFIEARGKTGLGAIKLALTESGTQFRQNGLAWWDSLSWLQKISATIFG